ncbi:MBL fold metallo-hydrolase [Actinokineospora diospyrosa]|uniref:Glyoxylase, beta-lactamase superfamily II n=1 Tax=Actinokineospora diospyrosa TaxID=103728 RepID=A0ABT1I5B7_9PSEU|nr:rhodanese-like domain-containing protein [Actinokineospora diospyrosa]MCP2267810.1 Glyoxylase, beta-lactamase superfamily II [Actinokineospora diospyrosa]
MTSNLVFAQYYTECLSQASYLVGDRRGRRAAVIDPRRDIGTYLADAKALGLRIEWVLETHVHADFLSGHLELAEATGAVIGYGSAAELDFPVHRLVDRRRISLGEVDLEVLHTPGHTPESICLVLREHADDEVPYGVLTGDTLFLGDVGRPDLLSSNGWSARELASALYRSTRRLLELPDETRVFPGHGAGSACGKNLSTATIGTIGEQRRTNYALASTTEREFVRAVCAGQPTAPRYFAYAAGRNRASRPIFDEHDPVPEVSAVEGSVFLDTRDPEEFAAGHLPESVNVGLGGRYAEIAGTVLGAEDEIVLVCEPEQAMESRNRLARIGFDRVRGYTRPQAVRRATRLSALELALVASERQLVDVRGPGEVESSGTITGAVLIPLPELLARLDELDRDRPTVVFCAGGYRSSVAASTLRANGFADVADLAGGFSAWTDSDLPTVAGERG